MMKIGFKWAFTAIVAAMAAPASAQIISTSLPREADGGTAKKWSLHVMGSPFAKWQIKDYAILPTATVEDVLGAPRGSLIPSSQGYAATVEVDTRSVLLAAEGAYQVTDTLTLGAGLWYNHIGNAESTVALRNVQTNASVGPLDAGESDRGSVSEFHANVFYKNFGLQAGIINVSNELLNDSSRSDSDAYLVYKGTAAKIAFSIGAGIYQTGEVTGEINSEALSRPSGFVTLSYPLVKGLTIDGSLWFIGKSKGSGDFDVSDSMSRYMIGVGYSL